jgi:hypothetical protein
MFSATFDVARCVWAEIDEVSLVEYCANNLGPASQFGSNWTYNHAICSPLARQDSQATESYFQHNQGAA